MSMLINYSIPALMGMIQTSNLNLERAWVMFKGVLVSFPLFHLFSFYANAPSLDWSLIVVILCIPLGLILGGLIMQKTNGGDRVRNSLFFSIYYVIIAIAVQLFVAEFQFKGWLNLFTRSGLGIRSGAAAFLISLIIFFVTVFALSILGTALSSRRD
jgi:hypothetical protein